jgi:hypothetical protein
MSTWKRDTIELMQHVTLWNNTKEMWWRFWIRSPVTCASVVHSNHPSWATWRTHAPTINKWHKQKKIKNEIKKVTLHILTHGAMRGCGLTSSEICINNKFHDIRERNVTIRSEIWTTNTRSLEFGDIRECMRIWRLRLWNLGCMHTITHNTYIHIYPQLAFNSQSPRACTSGAS